MNWKKNKRFKFGRIFDYLNPTVVLTKLKWCDPLGFLVGIFNKRIIGIRAHNQTITHMNVSIVLFLKNVDLWDERITYTHIMHVHIQRRTWTCNQHQFRFSTFSQCAILFVSTDSHNILNKILKIINSFGQ